MIPTADLTKATIHDDRATAGWKFNVHHANYTARYSIFNYIPGQKKLKFYLKTLGGAIRIARCLFGTA
jgi:hypothetical protein